MNSKSPDEKKTTENEEGQKKKKISLLDKLVPPGLFRKKIFVLVLVAVLTPTGIFIYHCLECGGGKMETGATATIVQQGSGAHNPSDTEHSKIPHHHHRLLVKWILVLALLYTAYFTFFQYFAIATTNNGSMEKGHAALLAFVLFLLGCGAVDILYPNSFLEKASPQGLSFLFPYWKNLFVTIIAGLFWYIDHKETSFNDAVPDDRAVFYSILLSSIFVGIAHKDIVNDDFIKYYNTGAVAFHLILGTLIFDETLKPKNSPGDPEDPEAKNRSDAVVVPPPAPIA